MTGGEAASKSKARNHNLHTARKELNEEGFENLTSEAVSQFTIFLHTSELSAHDERRFAEYADEREYLVELESDLDGDVYRMNI